jgi:hypothetical protein
VYPLLDSVSFHQVLSLSRPITSTEFDAWHETETKAMCSRDPRLPTGWGAKLINVYLKTAAYIGDLGRPGLREVLHPPIDAGLWEGLKRQFKERSDLLDQICCVERIKDIKDYPTYLKIIAGCRTGAQELGWTLIELEKLWLGSSTPLVSLRRWSGENGDESEQDPHGGE